MQKGKVNLVVDGFHGSSGKGKISTYLADRDKPDILLSTNMPNAGHCQSADTWIITNIGLERLGDVVNQKNGTMVVNGDGEWSKIGDYVPDGIRVTNNIELSNGIYFNATDVHRFLVWDAKLASIQWVRSIDLQSKRHQFLFPKLVEFPSNSLRLSDVVLRQLPNKKDTIGNPNEEKFAEWMGLLIGDGYYAGDNKISIAFNVDQLDVLEDMQKFYKEIGIESTNVYKVINKDCVVLTINQVSDLKKYLTHVGFNILATRDDKITPRRVLQSNKKIIAAFLRGLFDSDGSCKKDRVTLSNISSQLLKETQQMLYILGIHSSFSTYIDNREGVRRRRQHTISVNGFNSLITFKEKIGFLSAVKNSKLDSLLNKLQNQGQLIRLNLTTKRNLSKTLKSSFVSSKPNTKSSFINANIETLALHFPELVLVAKDYYIIDIKSVNRNINKENVFDLTVPILGSYIANGAISHNTAIKENVTFISKILPTPAFLTNEKYKPLVVLGGSAAFYLRRLFLEMDQCGLDASQVVIHPRAGVVTDEHAARERETLDGPKSIASTLQGCGTFLSDKILRRPGVKLAKDFRELDLFIAKGFLPITLQSALRSGSVILGEVSQGVGLDILHGSHYPNCTSRSCTPMQFMSDFGLSHNDFGDIYLNVRPFPIRVGNLVENGETVGLSGDFFDDAKEITWRQLGEQANMPLEEVEKLFKNEMTTVTKRLRRVFEFSEEGLIRAVVVTGATKLSLNFAQYIDWGAAGLKGGPEAYSDLPQKVKDFVERLENRTGLPVVLIGTGPANDEIIDREFDQPWYCGAPIGGESKL